MNSLQGKISSVMNTKCLRRNLFSASSPLPAVQLPAKKYGMVLGVHCLLVCYGCGTHPFCTITCYQFIVNVINVVYWRTMNFQSSITLECREVHFWYILPYEVNSTNLLNQYLEILSPCEKENIFRMRGELLKKRALLARALVRTTLARYQTNCQIDPKSLKFRKNSYGKPEVDWQYSDDWSLPPLHFNISHTSSLIACGVTVNYPIGIDVEEKQRRLKNNILAFAGRYFTLHEVEMLTGISDPETQQKEFIKLWTLKEAYVKALGKGFSASPFNTFTVRLRDYMKKGTRHAPHLISEVPEIIIESSGDPNNPSGNWQFVLLELLGSHYAAICLEQDMIAGGNGGVPINLTIRRTIPFVEDEYISGTDVVVVGGLTRLLGSI